MTFEEKIKKIVLLQYEISLKFHVSKTSKFVCYTLYNSLDDDFYKVKNFVLDCAKSTYGHLDYYNDEVGLGLSISNLERKLQEKIQ